MIVFGDNKFGQLGLGHNQSLDLYFKKKNTKIESIYCGFENTLIVDQSGNGYTFGNNERGQIGNGQYGDDLYVDRPYLLPTIKKIQCAFLTPGHSIILCQNEKVFTFGNNSFKKCSSKISDRHICNPYLLTKQEIGIDHKDHIIKVMGSGGLTVIVVNQQ